MGKGIARQRRRFKPGEIEKAGAGSHATTDSWIDGVRPSRRAHGALLRMRSFLCAIYNLPHPEERGQARLAVRDAAMRRVLTVRGRTTAMPSASRPQIHPLQANDAVGEGGEAVELGARAPQPFEMIEKDMRAGGEIDRRSLGVERLALTDHRALPRLGQQRIELGVAILAPVEEAVAGEPDADIAVGIPPAAPDHHPR